MDKKLVKGKNFIRGLNFNIVISITRLLLVFCIAVSIIGYFKFTDSLTNEYINSAIRTAGTANEFLDPELIKDWSEEVKTLYNKDSEIYRNNVQNFWNDKGEEAKSDYYELVGYLTNLADRQEVIIIYVIVFDDTENFQNFYSFYNCVNPRYYGDYTPWEIGEFRNTTNGYQQKYSKLFNGDSEYESYVRDTGLNGYKAHITAMIPVKSDNDVVGILCVQRYMEELVTGRVSYIILVCSLTVLLSIMVILISSINVNKQFASPIKKIVSEAERFASENSILEQPLSEDISKINEIRMLISSINAMEKETVDYIIKLSDVVAEKQRIGTELSLANIIQQNSVPTDFPAFPDRNEFDVYASMTPAKEVGGDFYDFFLIDDDHLALVIADVSGKGIPAALYMMVTKILINDRALMGGTPAEILEFVNSRLCESNKADLFVTAWLGILEISTGKVVAVSAGHDDPAIYKKGGEYSLFKTKHGLVLGAVNDVKYKNYEIKLDPGDKIFLYTDGVPEANAKNKNMLTLDGMTKLLNDVKDLSPKQTIESIKNNIFKFIGDEPQFDDITMVSLEYRGGKKLIKIHAIKENLPVLRDFVSGICNDLNVSAKVSFQLNLVAEEIFTNVANYAYVPDEGDIEVSAVYDDNVIKLTFTDSGKQYDPLKKPDPDITLSAEERGIGGLGIFLTKKLVDDVKYEYVDGKNILILEKRI